MKDNEERTDFFNDLMFGKRYDRDVNIDANEHKDNIDDWFGEKKEEGLSDLPLPAYIKDLPIGKIIENIDYNELMKSIDTIVTTTGELKPLLKKIKPYIEAFLEKNK